MAALASVIPELEDAIQRGSPERRARTLEQVTNLFLQSAPLFNEEHVALFDDVLTRLVVEIETKALAALANRIAPVGNAPVKLMKRLARDTDIAVAGPVLQQSARLNEADLVEIARSMSQDHLLAISNREEVPAAVSDVLVGRGNRDVVRNLSANRQAKLSELGYATLVKRARHDGELAECIGQRPDVPAHLLRTLISQATEVVQRKMLASTRPETQAEIRSVLAKVSGDIGQNAQRDFASAQVSVLELHKSRKLGERELVGFAKGGRYEETIVALSALCSVPVDVVERLVTGDRPDPILIMCKAVGFDWATARPIILLRPGSALSAQAMEAAMTNFDRLTRSTAERVLRFWQARQGSAHSFDRG